MSKKVKIVVHKDERFPDFGYEVVTARTARTTRQYPFSRPVKIEAERLEKFRQIVDAYSEMQKELEEIYEQQQ
jgi:hypothetical protein